MNLRPSHVLLAVSVPLAFVGLGAIATRGPAFAEPESSTLPPIFRVGSTVQGVSASGAKESMTVVETQGKWVRAQAEGGQLVWLAPETWLRWADSAGPGDPAGSLALSQMAAFGAAIGRWKLSKHSLPATLEDLTHPDEVTRETYIESGRIPLDPWGKPYAYRIVDAQRLRFQIASGGPDKLLETDDDIYYPERSTPK